jgi:hypothetical protein
MTSVPTAPACAFALAAALAASGCAGARPRAAAPPAAVPERAAFQVPGHGALVVTLPQGWNVETLPGDAPAPLTFKLTVPGGAFVALLSPFWNPGEPEDESARVDNAQLFADMARRGALAGAVEKEIPLEELVGAAVHGFWFSATDRSLAGKEPVAGEWRHLLQGVAAVGPIVFAFTLLDNGPGPQRDQFLAAVRGATHANLPGDGAEGEATDGGDGDEEDAGPVADPASTVPLAVEIPGKSWTVLVDLPGFRMFRPRPVGGAGAVVVGHDPDRGIVASVVIRSSEGSRDAAACREADLARIAAAHANLSELRRSQAGPAARALYVMPDVGGKPIPQLHGHAWLQRDGVCVNVHVSKAAPEPEDAAALERILGTIRYGTDL